MVSSHILNPLDIIVHKKDFFWGKRYFGLFDEANLIDTILYSRLNESRALIEIHGFENNNEELLERFLVYFSKRQVRYFIRELLEISEDEDIAFMQKMGFKRFNRNFCFEYSQAKELKINHVFCRDAHAEDIKHLLELDIASQILEYRDELYRGKRFLRKNIHDISVFVDSHNIDHVLAFAIRKADAPGHSFEFVIHPSLVHMSLNCIEAFAEKYLRFEKNPHFYFILNENQKSVFAELEQLFKLRWTSQLLIYEGAPRDKVAEPGLAQVYRRAPALGLD